MGLPSGRTRLEEGDYLPVYIGEPFDKDEVPSPVKHPKFRTGDGPGQGGGVGDGHVAVFGAVDNERWRGYVPDVMREVEACSGPGLLIVRRVGRRVRKPPIQDLLELVSMLSAVRL